MKFTWDLTIANFADFSLIVIIKSWENKLPSSLNFNEIRCKKCNENYQMASVFCYSQILYVNIRDKLLPRVKSEIQIRENFPAKLEKSKIRKIQLLQKSPTSRFQEMWKLWTMLFIMQFEHVCITISTITHYRITEIFQHQLISCFA